MIGAVKSMASLTVATKMGLKTAPMSKDFCKDEVSLNVKCVESEKC